MFHESGVILLLCLSRPHQTVRQQYENMTPSIENETFIRNDESLENVTRCYPSPPFLTSEPPASITGHEATLITITIVFCDIFCSVRNSSSARDYDDIVNITSSHSLLTNVDYISDDINSGRHNEDNPDTSNTTVEWSLAGLTLFPGTW